eukprot:402218-Lingulodinium_polyedra.AAC.1
MDILPAACSFEKGRSSDWALQTKVRRAARRLCDRARAGLAAPVPAQRAQPRRRGQPRRGRR